MPSANPFAPTIEVSGGASIGGVAARGSGSFGVAENTAAAGYVLLGLGLLFLLWKSKFRFSTTVG